MTIGFNPDLYAVTEGESVAVTVSVTPSGVTLDRDVTVTVVGVPGEVTVEPEEIAFSSGTLSHTVTIIALPNTEQFDTRNIEIYLIQLSSSIRSQPLSLSLMQVSHTWFVIESAIVSLPNLLQLL